METLDFKLLIACQVRMPARPVVAFIMHRDNAPRINDLLHYYPSFSLYTKGREFSKASHIHLPECSPWSVQKFWLSLPWQLKMSQTKLRKQNYKYNIEDAIFNYTPYFAKYKPYIYIYIYIRHYSNLQHHGATWH